MSTEGRVRRRLFPCHAFSHGPRRRLKVQAHSALQAVGPS